MTLRGVGIDVASIARVGSLLGRRGQSFLTRWFDPSELEGFRPDELAAGVASRFATKEAVWKALRLDPPGPLAWRQIVVTAADGRHAGLSVRLEGSLAARAEAAGVGPITATAVVHSEIVVAVALVEAV